MTEEEFRNGPAKQRPLEEFSDKPNEPSHINPFGLSDRELEEARRLNAGMANRATISEALHLPDPDDWGCDYCRNDGPLDNAMGTPRCPRCDAEYPGEAQ